MKPRWLRLHSLLEEITDLEEQELMHHPDQWDQSVPGALWWARLQRMTAQNCWIRWTGSTGGLWCMSWVSWHVPLQSRATQCTWEMQQRPPSSCSPCCYSSWMTVRRWLVVAARRGCMTVWLPPCEAGIFFAFQAPTSSVPLAHCFLPHLLCFADQQSVRNKGNLNLSDVGHMVTAKRMRKIQSSQEKYVTLW